MLTFSQDDTFRYIAYITHSRIHRASIVVKRPSQHPPWRSSWTNAYLANSVICSLFPVKPRWRLVLKHRRNVGKPSFCKIPHKTLIHDTLSTALNNIYRVPCEFVRWLWILVRTKNRPSSIIIRYSLPPHMSKYSTFYDIPCARMSHASHQISYGLNSDLFIH